MKKILLILGIISLLMACDHKETDLSTQFGTKDFTTKDWLETTNTERGAMVHSLLLKNDLVGKDKQHVLNLLGEPTGYYFYDEDLAYIIGDSSNDEMFPEYLLVFMIKEGKISSIYTVPSNHI